MRDAQDRMRTALPGALIAAGNANLSNGYKHELYMALGVDPWISLPHGAMQGHLCHICDCLPRIGLDNRRYNRAEPKDGL